MVKLIRSFSAIALVALEFTNAFTFFAEGGATPSDIQHSRFTVGWASFAVAALIICLDSGAFQRLLRKGVTTWALATLILLSWAMLIRTVNAPAGWPSYLVLRDFGLTVYNIGFLLIITVILDDRDVVVRAKAVVVIATIVAIVLNLYDLVRPGLFSVIRGRAAGLYVDPNMSGMAITFGCLLGLTWIRSVWIREVFVLCSAIGVITTASREAMLSFAIIVAFASWSHVLSARRLAFVAVGAVVFFIMLGVANRLTESRLFTQDSWSRLTLNWSDASTHGRENTLEYTLELFEQSPLVGQGYGTQVFWGEGTATHNIYLDFMVDCGVIGVLVIPGLLFSVGRRTPDFYAFALSFGVWGLFNHELLSEFFSLITLAIQANESWVYNHAINPRHIPLGVASERAEGRASGASSGYETSIEQTISHFD